MDLPAHVSAREGLLARLQAVLGADNRRKPGMLQSKRWARAAVLMAVAALTVLLAACGSSSGSNSTQSAADKQSGGAASQVAAAQGFIARFASPPTTIPVTTPVLKAPTPGRTVVYLQCSEPQCVQIGDGEASAAAAVGWQFKRINFDLTNAATLVAGMKQALQYNPVAVTVTSVPYALWASEVPAYTAAHVPIVTQYTGDVPSNPTIIANIGGNNDLKLHADLMANWFIADSHATGKARFYTVPDFPGLVQVTTEFQAAVKAGCAACSVQLINGTPTQVASSGVNAAIVAALRRDSSFNYLIMADYPLTSGIPTALKAAGISGVKIAGIYATAADGTLIKQGQEQAGTPSPVNIPSWLAVDAMIRYSEGMPNTDSASQLPIQLLTPSTVGTPTNSYDFPGDYQEQFKKLWKVG
jgi:ribose transport system substrate-binding protein